MSLIAENESELIWVKKKDKLPDTCCMCGLFTYDRVTVKFVEHLTTQTNNAGCVMVVFTLFLHLLGPIGWILAFLVEGDKEEGKPKIVKQKSKLKMSQCNLCHANGPPEVVEHVGERFSFFVHPRFRDRFYEAQLAAEE